MVEPFLVKASCYKEFDDFIWSLDTRKPSLYQNFHTKFDLSILNSTDLSMATESELDFIKSTNSGVVLMDRTENGSPEEIT